MTAFRDLLAEGLLLRRQRYLALAAPGVAERAREDLADGFLAVITEALRGEENGARRSYLDIVVPRLLLAGDPDAVSDTLVTWTVEVIDDVVSWLPTRARHEAVVWLAGFFASHVLDLDAARRAVDSRACA